MGIRRESLPRLIARLSDRGCSFWVRTHQLIGGDARPSERAQAQIVRGLDGGGALPFQFHQSQDLRWQLRALRELAQDLLPGCGGDKKTFE